MSLEGRAIVKYGRYGTKIGEFNQPFECMCDDDDNLLIVDFWNNRLQLLHGEKWSKIKLQPPPMWPHKAVFDGRALYMFDIYINLLKYEPENACVLI